MQTDRRKECPLAASVGNYHPAADIFRRRIARDRNQLVAIRTDNLNSAVGEVAFSALSRLQDDPIRRKSYFLKGSSLVLKLILPITIACALFADDVVFFLLGPKGKDAAAIVRSTIAILR
jgi:Polysaccharide biosynthesis protein